MMGEHIHTNWRGNRVYAGKGMYAGKAETGEEASRAEEQESAKAPFMERQDRLEISSEGRDSVSKEKEAETSRELVTEELSAEEAGAAEETEEVREEDAAPSESEERSGKVGFNGGKRARQLAAASTPEQVQMVIDLLNKDLDDCEAGLKQGMCDENEVAKVKAMLQRARQRMTEVSGQEQEEEGQGIDAFAMASLM